MADSAPMPMMVPMTASASRNLLAGLWRRRRRIRLREERLIGATGRTPECSSTGFPDSLTSLARTRQQALRVQPPQEPRAQFRLVRRAVGRGDRIAADGQPDAVGCGLGDGDVAAELVAQRAQRPVRV